MSEQPTIRVRDLKKAFGNKVVLDGANLDVWPGESVVVIGQSGVGKSVLIKCIIGILAPDEGTIEIDGEIITAAGLGTWTQYAESSACCSSTPPFSTP